MVGFLLLSGNVQGRENGVQSEIAEKNEQEESVKNAAIMAEDITGFWDFFRRRILANFDAGVSIEEKFDDNIYDTWSDTKNKVDFVTTISPFISYDYSTQFFEGKSKIEPHIRVELSGDIEYYMFSPKLNNQNSADFDDLFNPAFSALMEEPTNGLTLYFDAERSRKNSSEVDALIGATDKEKIDTNTTTYGATYEFGPKQTKWEIGYEHTHTGYGGRYRPFDKGTDTVTVTTLNKIGDGVLPSIVAGYDMENTKYLQENTGNTGGTTYNLWTGLEGKFSPKIDGAAKVGYGILAAGDRRKDPVTAIIWAIDMTYRITDRFSCNFIVGRHVGNVFGAGDASFNIAGDLKGSNEYSLECTYTPPFFSDDLTLGADFSQKDLTYLSGETRKVREVGLSYSYIWDDRSKGWWTHKWTLQGEYKFRRTSPSEGWDRFLNNEISLKLTTEF